MDFSIIGAGNVAYHLHKALTEGGSSCEKILVRKSTKLQWAKNTSRETDLSSFHSKFFIIAVSDNEIENVIQNYAFPADSIVAHTAGAISIDVFKNRSITQYGVFYPLQTLSKSSIVNYKELPVYIEGSSHEVLEFLKQTASTFSSKVENMTSKQRVSTHVAAVFASNFTNYLFHLAENLMLKNDLSPEIIYPLIDETIRKFKDKGAFESQTGPARRNDQSTIDKHMAQLEDSEIQDLYKNLTNRIRKTYNQHDKRSD